MILLKNPSKILVNDKFTDSNGTAITAHTVAPVNKPGNSYVNRYGTHDIQSNKADALTYTTNFSGWTLETGWSDVIITYTTNIGNAVTTQVGPIFRFVDTSNYWLAQATAGGGFVLWKIEGGTGTNMGSDSPSPALAVDMNLTYTVTLSGNSITVAISGDSSAEVSISNSFQNTATLHGWRPKMITVTTDPTVDQWIIRKN